MNLIPEWKKAWKLASVRLALLGVVLSSSVDLLLSAWNMLPRILQDKLPNSKEIAIIFLVLTVGARIVSFRKKSKDNDEEEK